MTANEHLLYYYSSGLRDIIDLIKNNTVIYTGIRPTGYHRDNSIALAVYPHLIAAGCVREGKDADFSYIITLNDHEPKDYDWNLFVPGGVSIQLSTDCTDVEERIWRDIGPLRQNFPHIRVSIVRASALLESSGFEKMFREMLVNPKEFAEAHLSQRELERCLSEHCQFTGLICKSCNSPVRPDLLDSGSLISHCGACGRVYSDMTLSTARVWMHWAPLIAAKWLALSPDIAIFGADYVLPPSELGDFATNEIRLDAILRLYNKYSTKPVNVLIAPLLIGSDGKKMSKDYGNLHPYEYKDIYNACLKHNSTDLLILL